MISMLNKSDETILSLLFWAHEEKITVWKWGYIYYYLSMDQFYSHKRCKSGVVLAVCGKVPGGCWSQAMWGSVKFPTRKPCRVVAWATQGKLKFRWRVQDLVDFRVMEHLLREASCKKWSCPRRCHVCSGWLPKALGPRWFHQESQMSKMELQDFVLVRLGFILSLITSFFLWLCICFWECLLGILEVCGLLFIYRVSQLRGCFETWRSWAFKQFWNW